MPLIAAGFPEYVYRPYPKYIARPDGSGIVAEHAAHEAEIRASFEPAPKEEPKLSTPKRAEPKAIEQEAGSEGDDHEDAPDKEALEAERQMLLQECVARGIKVHPKTGIAKLKAALE